MKNILIKKLTSRKFLSAFLVFLSTFVIALKSESLSSEQLSTIIAGISTVCTYIIGESIVDINAVKSEESEEKYD